MERILPRAADVFGTARVCLVDYYEQSHRFELIHFEGYPPDSRFELTRRFLEMEVSRATMETSPYWSRQNPRLLCVPLYFRRILEAVLVFEGDAPIELSEPRRELAQLLSKALGLFMSSARLEVNRELLLHASDLQKAREIQLNFLPREFPCRAHSEVFGHNSPSALVGGDYLDYFEQSDRSIRCILADACGHGLAAALIMSNFHGLLKSQLGRQERFELLFDELNQQVHLDEDFIQYLTGVLLHYEADSRSLSYLNAGHYEPLVVGREGTVRSLSGGGPPLGMFKASRYPLMTTRLAPGDLLAVFTDGLVDAETPDGRYFGSDGIASVLARHRADDLSELTERVIDTARRFSARPDFEDDVTLLLLRVN
jgi:serine phosphatase RsbU (regulator of sigma subunit)